MVLVPGEDFVGMSDLSTYEFGDIVWDEFCMNDDHTVPLPGVEQANEHSLWDDNHKKTCHGVVGVQDNAQDKSSSKNVGEEKEPEDFAFKIVNNKKRMLENDPVPQTSDCVFDSCNKESGKEASLAHDANRRLSDCFKRNSFDSLGIELCDDAIPADKTAPVDSNSYGYPLSQTENDLAFFDETHDIKNSKDFLYNGWPDISNLEEVEQIFSNEDEFGWFASSEAVESTIDGSKPEFKFSYSDSSPVECNSDSCEPRNETHPLGGECFHEVQHKIPKTDHSSNDNSELPKHGAQFWGETEEQYLAYGGHSKSLHDGVSEKPLIGASSDVFSCKGIKQEKLPMAHESLSYLPCNIDYMHSDYSCPSDLTSEYGALSAVKFDTDGIKPIFPKESYSSKRVLSAESSHGNSCQTTKSTVPDEKVSLSNPVSIQKKVQHPANKFGIIGHAEEVLTELCPSTLQESSSVSSTLDLEVASFHQLQLVMEQLDPRTKLCIRNSLYRLARSAAQRHNHTNLDVGCSRNDDENRGAMMEEGEHKYTGFMDMETDTNPLDRSIAHLLFHRPSAPTAIPTQEHPLHHSATAIHGCILRPQVVSEKYVDNESDAAETERELAHP